MCENTIINEECVSMRAAISRFKKDKRKKHAAIILQRDARTLPSIFIQFFQTKKKIDYEEAIITRCSMYVILYF